MGGQGSALQSELTSLTEQQVEAMESATFVDMSNEETEHYEARGRRITEINRALGVKSDPPEVTSELW